MIFVQSYLKVLDNSGALIVKCIKILNKSLNKGAIVGDYVIVTIKKIKSIEFKYIRSGKKLRLKKKGLHKALIVRVLKFFLRKNGTGIKFYENGVILFNELNNPLGTRIYGPFLNELRCKKFSKLIVMAGLLF